MGTTATIGMTVFGMQQAQTDSDAIKAESVFRANQMEFNARLKEKQAEDSLKRGHEAVTEQRKRTKRVIGTQRAALAAQGINIDDGSALAIQEDTAMIGELDALTIKNNAWREAWGHKAEAADLKSSANFTRVAGEYEAKQAIVTGGLSAIQSGMSLGSSISGFGKIG